jgi:hypothetical protein
MEKTGIASLKLLLMMLPFKVQAIFTLPQSNIALEDGLS